MNDILVTGGSGLVGSCFDNCLKISSKDCNLLDYNQTLSYIRNIKPRVIIHCAAKVGGVGSNMTYKGDFFYQNIVINTNLVEAARRCSVERVVGYLSTCIFPHDVQYPLRSEYLHNGPPHFSNDAYAYAKRMLQVQFDAYREQYGLNYFSVVPTNVYGLNDNYHVDNGHVIPSLIHKMYRAKIENKPFKVWGSGKPLREFIFAQDLADITMLLLEKYNGTEPVIVSPEEEISIKDVVELIAEVIEFNGEIIYETDKPDGQFRKPTDCQPLRDIIGDYKFTSLKDGLIKTVDYFLNNYSNIRQV